MSGLKDKIKEKLYALTSPSHSTPTEGGFFHPNCIPLTKKSYSSGGGANQHPTSATTELQPGSGGEDSYTKEELQPQRGPEGSYTKEELQPNRGVETQATKEELQPGRGVETQTTKDELQPGRGVETQPTKDELQPR